MSYNPKPQLSLEFYGPRIELGFRLAQIKCHGSRIGRARLEITDQYKIPNHPSCLDS